MAPITPATANTVPACRCGRYIGPDRPRVEYTTTRPDGTTYVTSAPWRCENCGTGTDDHYPTPYFDPEESRCGDCDRRLHSHGQPKVVTVASRGQVAAYIAEVLWSRGIGSREGGRKAAEDLVDGLARFGILTVYEEAPRG